MSLSPALSGPRGSKIPRAPRLPPLGGDVQRRKIADDGGGLTLEVAARFSDLAPGQIIVDSRDDTGRGYALWVTERQTVRFEMCDGWQAAFWDCDAGLLKTNTLHHIVALVDGRARVISFLVDGVLCDGGAQRQFGFGRFNANFKDISGGQGLRVAPVLHGELAALRVYKRTLLTSEAVGNFRAVTAQAPR